MMPAFGSEKNNIMKVKLITAQEMPDNERFILDEISFEHPPQVGDVLEFEIAGPYLVTARTFLITDSTLEQVLQITIDNKKRK